jgi:hypothetical protein
MFKNPECRHCGRAWKPRLGIVAPKEFCPRCSAERRKIAGYRFGPRLVGAEDFDGNYLLPRALRRPPFTAT